MIKHGDRLIWVSNGKGEGGGYIFLSLLIKFPVPSLTTVNYFFFVGKYTFFKSLLRLL